MVVEKNRMQELVKNFSLHDKDTGSCGVQVAILTERINSLTAHFKTHKKDYSSRVGLLRLVSQRKRLLEYLKGQDIEKHRELVEKLKLKK
ncbi:MAG: 30S ribosomal protein S15 [Candidatus Omnitrophota bacterium]|jgi:small subunit ribosomal protein S15|nr:30S ribosomal protein S15 [Candidatus Omnitrophota bacterium]